MSYWLIYKCALCV